MFPVAELVNAADLGSVEYMLLGVQVPPGKPKVITAFGKN